jgi:hypothetical protein
VDEDRQQPPLVAPPVNSSLAVREVKFLILLVAVLVGMVVISLAVGGEVGWVFDAIIWGLFLSSVFQRR